MSNDLPADLPPEQQRRLLEAFVLDNPELVQLEEQFARFNMFEAIGMVRQEIRHSEFLAFLLDPQANHGLGDDFVSRFLQSALREARESNIEFATAITPVHIALWSLDSITVLREWNSIDILLLDARNRLAVIIENKIFTGEHSDQLARYKAIVQRHYPDWHIIGVFLSPTGMAPSGDMQNDYVALDYKLVCTLLDDLLERRSRSMGAELRMVLTHYIEMLRRHIVSNDIPQLCQDIYRKHKQAIDLIIQHMPDRQTELYAHLERLIQGTKEIKLYPGNGRSVLYFLNPEWDIPLLKDGSDNTLYFEINNEQKRIRVRLMIGKGEESARQRLLDMAWGNKKVFNAQNRALGKTNTIAFHELLDARAFDEIFDTEDLVRELEVRWKLFVGGSLKEIISEVNSQEWVASELNQVTTAAETPS